MSGSGFDVVEREEQTDDQPPLDGYKTNDMWYHKPIDEKEFKINTRVLGGGVIGILLFTGVITAVVWGADSLNNVPLPNYDHSRVRVTTTSTACNLMRNCSSVCTDIAVEHTLGCCTGCGLAETCNFPVNVSWYNVPALTTRQRVWLLASLDGTFWFQSGWGAFVTNTSGWAMVTNGCYGNPGYAIILAACLSQGNLQDLSWNGFPSRTCNSSWGICSSTQNVLIQPLSYCNGPLWWGNYNIQTWDVTNSGPESASVLMTPSMSLTVLLVFMMFVLHKYVIV